MQEAIMKTQKNILIAFILNLFFAVFEFFGGIFTNSVAIVSDAVHDLGDAMSIGISYFLERKSKRQPDHTYTYGYVRYSVLGGIITTVILLVGSILVILNAIDRIFHPTPIRYDGMILFAIVGVVLNFLAAYATREGDSINQRAVNLHMLEDVLGWVVVLIGAVVMRFTDFALLDPLMSIGVAVFILINTIRNLCEVARLFLLKVPDDLSVEKVEAALLEVPEIQEVHHIHLWSLDGIHGDATMHIVADGDSHHVKHLAREALATLGIQHSTLELEVPGEHCHDQHCHVDLSDHEEHHHHHHHHH